jgi:multicomponent Na+:H+ antiporter subunit E
MTAARRTIGFALVWIAFAGVSPADLVPGVLAVGAAVLLSLRLLPPSGHPSAAGTAWFALRFLRQSLLAGLDVARRAFDPGLPLSPGFVDHQVRVPEGRARDALTAVLSLQPGTLPVAALGNNPLRIHCLDASQPVSAQLTADEAAFAAMLGRGGRHG